MTPEDVLSIIRGIGEMLSPTAQQAWEIAMRQVRVETVSNAIWASVLLGLAIGCLRFFFRGSEMRRKYGNDDAGANGLLIMILAGVVFVISACLGLAALQGALERAINPDWYAIKLLLGK